MPSLKFLPIGGVGEVTKNMFLYETQKDILVVDCGAGLPEEEKEDYIFIPDFSYLHQNREKIRGVVISHAHFDHYGGLPYFLSDFDVPVYGSRLTLSFVSDRLREMNFHKRLDFHVLRPKKKLHFGELQLTAFRVNHSVPEAFGFVLDTPAGKIFHMADYKFDLTPFHGPVFDFASCVQLSAGGVLALFSDCLGAREEGFTQTEQAIEEALASLIAQAQHQVFVTTLSSNLSRIQQIINASRRAGRRVVVLGRSLEKSIKIGQRLGYLKTKNGLLKKRGGEERKIVYLVAGSYGQSQSTLTRISQDKNPRVKLKKGDMVIFSADPSPPNTKDKVDRLVDLLTLKGAEVHYYEIQENLHVSGHGSSGDIKLLFALTRPQFLVPIGGCPRHMRAYSLLAQKMGWAKEKVLELLSGETLLLNKNKIEIGPRLFLKEQEVPV